MVYTLVQKVFLFHTSPPLLENVKLNGLYSPVYDATGVTTGDQITINGIF